MNVGSIPALGIYWGVGQLADCLTVNQDVEGSSPSAPARVHNSMVECLVANENVAGSIPAERFGSVAQRVERRPEEAGVGGSTPSGATLPTSPSGHGTCPTRRLSQVRVL